MEFSAELLARLFVFSLFSLPALIALGKGIRAKTRSERLYSLAWSCALSVLISPELIFKMDQEHRPTFLLACWLVHTLIGLTGCILAIMALRSRGDGGVGVGRSIAALCGCLLHVGVAVSFFIFGSMGKGTPWVYQFLDGTHQVTLPSQDWKLIPSPDSAKGTTFRRRSPAMYANIKAKKGQTQAEYTRLVKQFKEYVAGQGQKLSQAQFRDGTNALGRSYSYFTAWEIKPEGKVLFVAGVFWWCPDKKTTISISIEGYPAMSSMMGQAAEKDTFLKSAESICLSVD